MEVEGEEVSPGDEDDSVARANEEGGDVGAASEEAERHDGVGGQFPFVEEEEADGGNAEDNETDDGSGAPGVKDAAIFETQEEHESPTDY